MLVNPLFLKSIEIIFLFILSIFINFIIPSSFKLLCDKSNLLNF